MFDAIANVLTLSVSVALPTFLSYKALQSIPPQPNNPLAAALTEDSTAKAALLTPWLTYWIINSLFLSANSTFSLLGYIPLYPWLRLGLHVYLLIPGSAERIYQQHVRPFLHRHEREIETFIADSHGTLKANGLDFLRRAVDWVRTVVLGEQAQHPPPQQQPHRNTADSPQSYVQALLARFSVASSAQAVPPPQTQTQAQVQAAWDVFEKFKTQFAASTASNAAAGSASSAGRHGAPAASRSAAVSSPETDMKKSRSETEFEKIERDDTAGPGAGANGKGSPSASAGWGTWIWGSGKQSAHGKAKAKGE